MQIRSLIQQPPVGPGFRQPRRKRRREHLRCELDLPSVGLVPTALDGLHLIPAGLCKSTKRLVIGTQPGPLDVDRWGEVGGAARLVKFFDFF